MVMGSMFISFNIVLLWFQQRNEACLSAFNSISRAAFLMLYANNKRDSERGDSVAAMHSLMRGVLL